jgi:hypothetical protein
MRSILAVGLDGDLLHTRVAVLKRTSADVTHGNPDAAIKILEVVPFDIIVLCHTLTPDDSTRVADAAHIWPKTYVLQVISNAMWSPSYEDVPVDGLCESDPGRLVERVMALLSIEANLATGAGKLLKFSRDPTKAG